MLSFLIKKLKYKKQPEKVVKAIILKNEELENIPYALLGLENETGKWKFIGGGVEKNEDIKDALFREVLEETGLALTDGNIDGEPYEYDVNGKKIYVYFIKHNGDLPNTEGDIDQEFKKLDWFPIGMIVKGKLDLSFPANVNVCVKAIMDKYKDFLSTRENIQIDEVQTDETNNKLSFKEKRELTKKLFELKEQILQTKDFKTKRKLTKEFFNLRDKILGKSTKQEEEQSQQTENQKKDEIIEKTKEILSKDDISLDDLEFFTPEVLKYLDDKEKEGNPEIKELEKIVKEKIQELESQLKKDGINFDEIELMFDSAEGEKLSSLFEKMFALRKAKSKKSESNRLKAFKELQKLIETDPDIRDMLEELIEDFKTYTDDADSVDVNGEEFKKAIKQGD